jgi:methyl-accepting chemotaxis protein
MRATIKLKLGLTFVVVIALSTASAVIAISGLGALRDSVDDLVDGAAQEVSLSEQLATNLQTLSSTEKDMIMANSVDQVQQYDSQIQKLRQEAVALQNKLAGIAHDEAKQKLAAFQASWEQWVPVQDKIRRLMADLSNREQA